MMVLFLFIALFIPFAVTSVLGANNSQSNESYPEIGINGTASFEQSVEDYRSEVERACSQFDTKKCQKTCTSLSNYVDLALAIMTEESHGSGTDPMQASECGYNTKYPRIHNGIKDASYSIDCGVQYMRDAIITAGVKSPTDFDAIAVAVQGYNFGVSGWCEWIKKKGGKYTVALATEYSLAKQKEYGWQTSYGCPTHAQKVLTTYRAALQKGNSGDISINPATVADIIKLNEGQAWQLLLGTNTYSTKPSLGNFEAVKKIMANRTTTITVNVWYWKNSSGFEKTTKTKNITVNVGLRDFWQAFFNDVYQDKSQIVINPDTLYSYSFRANTGGTSISAHAFGAAVDINPEIQGNGYGQTPYTEKQWKKLPEKRWKYMTIYHDSPLTKIAEKYTLSWGGDWRTHKDGMHFSFCGDVIRK